MIEIYKSDISCNTCGKEMPYLEKKIKEIFMKIKKKPKLVNRCNDCREESYQIALARNC